MYPVPQHLKKIHSFALVEKNINTVEKTWNLDLEDPQVGEFALAWDLLKKYLNQESLENLIVVTGMVDQMVSSTFLFDPIKKEITDWGVESLREFDVFISPCSYLSDAPDYIGGEKYEPLISEETPMEFLLSYWHQDNWVEVFDSLFSESTNKDPIFEQINDSVKEFYFLKNSKRHGN